MNDDDDDDDDGDEDDAEGKDAELFSMAGAITTFGVVLGTDAGTTGRTVNVLGAIAGALGARTTGALVFFAALIGAATFGRLKK